MSKRESNAGRRGVFCKGLLLGAAAAALGAGVVIFAAVRQPRKLRSKTGFPLLPR
jgi:hypothetical protein